MPIRLRFPCLRGAMPVSVSMPSWSNGWLLFPTGCLGNRNTFHFRGPFSTRERSLRLFLLIVFLVVWDLLSLIASQESLTDLDTGIAVGVSPQLALWTDEQGRTHVIPFFRLPLCVANDLSTATGTFPAGLLGIDPAGDDPGLVPRLVLSGAKDAALHPESSLRVASMTVPALLRLQIAEVLKRQDRGSLLSGELDNAMADLVGKIVISLIDFAPEIGVVLLARCKYAGFRALACNASKLLRALCRIPLSLRQ